ncbi:hypothetical protein [Qipengyuania sp. MTN3-11]|uniref:hypothetical protein n=1 Tax=Qipengyuania sp. MTN3-11 TaxID=3056557 RepID=UPI0036F36E0C
MGLVILVITGVLLGWLGSIVIQREHRTGIWTCVGAGVAGALAGGALSGNVPLLAGISPMQLLWALIGALAAIALADLIATRLGDGARP